MTRISNVSRRDFIRGLISAGALILGTEVAPEAIWGTSVGDGLGERESFRPNVFVSIEMTGIVSIIAHRSEMGNGSRTSLPLILADELDADWNLVRIVQAIGDPQYGLQDTDASQSIRVFFDAMREAGAAARLMLLRAAAAKWSVPESECETGLHNVIHVPTHQSISYGDLAHAASHLPLPAKGDVHLKKREMWRYIGKDTSLYDLENICRGKAVYGIDARSKAWFTLRSNARRPWAAA